MSRHYFFYFFCYICITGFTKAAYLRIYDESINKFEEFDLESPVDLLNAPGYDPTSDTVIYAFGFTGKADGITVRTILGTYLRLGGYNAILLNWEKEASAPLGPISYPITALKQVTEVGKKFGKALYKLVSAGLDLETTHLIGFSLGAQLMGYGGREVKKNKLLAPRSLTGFVVGLARPVSLWECSTGSDRRRVIPLTPEEGDRTSPKLVGLNRQQIPITGLDPAGPLFDEGVIKPLDSNSAKYVDVLHTNPGQFGSDESLGTIDFWFNCEHNIQPGCEALSPADETSCSHDRSWLYFSEALENTTAFEATAASSCSDWAALNETDSVAYVGENIKLGNKGKFYLSTNDIPPYGRGDSGVYTNNTNNYLL